MAKNTTATPLSGPRRSRPPRRDCKSRPIRLRVTLPASREDIVALSLEERAALFARTISRLNRPQLEALLRLVAAAASKREAGR